MNKEKCLNLLDKINTILTKYCHYLSFIIAGILFLIIYKVNNLYPFGSDSISWCDMSQQVVPLLNQLKDILSGKQSFQYNLAAAGGMSFFGVFFFFLSNPFSFLVIFVDKIDMLSFMNLIVMFKMMLCALISCWYFKKKYPQVPFILTIGLSLFYAFSSYNLMYYQNVMWLDLVYLFPLLLYGISRLLNERKIGLYLAMILMMIIMNYYLGMLVVIFSLIYIGLHYLFNYKEKGNAPYSLFLIISAIAALISGVVLIPSFIQYLASARTISFKESLMNSWFITSYQTTIPLILPTLFLIPFFFSKFASNEKKIYSILIVLLAIPLIIDPINKAWHLGSYQAFPCRFAFILTFLCLELVLMNLSAEKERKWDKKQIIGIVFALVSLIFIVILEHNYLKLKIDDLNRYSHSLWGNTTSLEALLRYYAIILLVGIFIYILYKMELLNKKTLSVSIMALAVIDVFFSSEVYLVSPSHSVEDYYQTCELEDLIQDDDFYRVKTHSRYFYANTLGGLGYNNVAHYTSLTSKDHLFTMKKLGYSSNWMEQDTYGGTTYTDALLINKYTIHRGKISNSVYQSEHYSVEQNKVYPFGIVTSSDLSLEEELQENTRALMQEHIYQTLQNDGSNLHQIYDYTSTSNLEDLSSEQGFKFKINSSRGELIYECEVKGTQDLYFEAFDKYSNSLHEHIENSFSITVNNYLKLSSYPSQYNNGTIYLGTFTDTNVRVKIGVLKNVELRSLSVYGVDEDKLSQSINSYEKSNLKVDAKGIRGTYNIDQENQYLFLPIVYSSSLNCHINNQKVEVYRVFSDFAAIKLFKGTNNIKITYSQQGMIIGSISTAIGTSLLGIYLFFKNDILKNEKANKIVAIILVSVSVIVLFVIYVLPMILNIIGQIISIS